MSERYVLDMLFWSGFVKKYIEKAKETVEIFRLKI